MSLGISAGCFVQAPHGFIWHLATGGVFTACGRRIGDWWQRMVGPQDGGVCQQCRRRAP